MISQSDKKISGEASAQKSVESILNGKSSLASNKKSVKDKPPFYVNYFYPLVVLLFFIIFIPGYLFLIKPEKNAHGADINIIKEKQTEMANAVEKFSRYRKINSSYSSISPRNSEKINSILPVGIDMPSLYVNIEAIADSAGVGLGNIDIAKIEEDKNKKKDTEKDNTIKGDLKSVSVNVNFFEVSYFSLKKILDIIESNVRLFDVKSFSYRPDDGQLSLVLTTYYIE